MAQAKNEFFKPEMLTEDEIKKISMGICPWPDMKAPERPNPQANPDKKVAG